MTEPLVVGGREIAPGSRHSLMLPVAQRVTGAAVEMPLHVRRGRHDGPRLFVSAAIHGDEINGVEIVRRLLARPELRRLHGTLLAVPIVNVFGFVSHARELPDKRDLNRSFPGSPRGSLASRIAHTFVEEIVANATHGVDLHTAARHRDNLPQVRACLDQPETEAMARAFGVPVILNANLRDGSLRQEVLERGVPMLVYEAGEALRFDETAIRAGVQGLLGVMRHLGMIEPGRSKRRAPKPFLARGSRWVRAPASGILRTRVRLGVHVTRGERIGVISDPLGREETDVLAVDDGIVIGLSRLPLVHEGDALFHVATFAKPEGVAERVETFQEQLLDD